MRRITPFPIYLLVVAILLSSCVVAPKTARVKLDETAVASEARKQRELAVKTHFTQSARLEAIAWPILRHNADLCKNNTRQSAGFTLRNVHHYKDADMQQAARDALHMDSHARIYMLNAQSPAAEAGISEGDIVSAINGKHIPATGAAPGVIASIMKASANTASWTVETVNAAGDSHRHVIDTVSICDFGVRLDESDTVNAFADGRNIILTQGMLRFTENEQELSLVVGHEIAHNIMQHISAKTTNYLLGTLLDLAAASYGVNTQNAFGKMSANAYSQDFEAEADYVGMYLIARAGYPLDGSADFWRKMAAIHPGSITSNHASSHPATPERFIAIEQSVEEIKRKVANNEPLDFEMKSENAAPGSQAGKSFGS